MRILDLYNNQIYSLCDDRIEQVFGEVLATRAEECNTYRPSALLYRDGKLYIGENIRIAVKSSKMEERQLGLDKPVHKPTIGVADVWSPKHTHLPI